MKPIVPLPQVIVEANGAPLPPQDAVALARVRVQQKLSLPTLCELAFCDPPGPLDVPMRLLPGTALRVLVAEYPTPVFEGEVTAVERLYGPAGEREVRVRGYDPLHRLRKRQPVRAHVEVTVEDLARQMASDLDLSVEAAEPGPLWQLLVQHHQSDFELLQEAAERCGLYLAVRGSTLHMLTLRGTGDPMPLRLGASLFEARVEVNTDPACHSVRALGWDALKVESHEGSATSADIGTSVPIEVLPSSVGGTGERDFVGESLPASSHAEGVAKAELDRRAASEVTIWGVAEGNPLLRPGSPVEVTGVANEFAGRYVLTEVTHTVDGQRGFLSEFSTLPPAPKRRPRSAVVAPGQVSQVDDPEHIGRVRVLLPTYGGIETGWMGVVAAGAGGGKGLVMLPDVGDMVLVLFSHEDPAQGLVLGGLYGVTGPPDSGVEGGAVKRYTLQTAGGQRVVLDDSRSVMRLETSEGSYIEFTPGRVRLHSDADLDIEAPGKRVTIRGDKIDFERA